MIKIDFPENKISTRGSGNKHEIFDPIRKRWVLLTPEEWVRQHIIQFLLVKNYPSSLIAVEKEMRVGALKKRGDIVVYNRDAAPWMIIECKKTNVALSGKTLEQVLRYHIALPAVFLVITNGIHCFGFRKKDGQFSEISEFPGFEERE